MKSASYILVFFISVSIYAQDSDYVMSSYLDEGFKAPNTHYIGEAWLNRLLQADDDLAYNITKATFKANSTLDWHKHTSVQVLIVVAGEGYYQEKGKEAVKMKTGDIIKCEKNTEHWHSSSKHSDVTYLALYGGKKPTIWTEVLIQENYDNMTYFKIGVNPFPNYSI